MLLIINKYLLNVFSNTYLTLSEMFFSIFASEYSNLVEKLQTKPNMNVHAETALMWTTMLMFT